MNNATTLKVTLSVARMDNRSAYIASLIAAALSGK
jgi:hypothetical protein